jgi:hypothetical protein
MPAQAPVESAQNATGDRSRFAPIHHDKQKRDYSHHTESKVNKRDNLCSLIVQAQVTGCLVQQTNVAAANGSKDGDLVGKYPNQ